MPVLRLKVPHWVRFAGSSRNSSVSAAGGVRQGSPPPFKGRLDRPGEWPNVEPPCVGECPEIMEVLHAAIGDSEHHHGLKLLGDDRLDWICAYGLAPSFETSG